MGFTSLFACATFPQQVEIPWDLSHTLQKLKKKKYLKLKRIFKKTVKIKYIFT
jgi:hypothetical protein